ncbi:MAG: hypothetical protein EXQ79_04515 [Acidimicrobiia bacterium]|nr:hypothetical protein [Acidimicrobiia bacterium]
MTRPAACVLAVVLLVGCGKAGPRLSVAGFTAKANKECAALGKASDAFRLAQDPAFEGADVRRFVRQVSARFRQLVRNIDELVPPEQLEDSVDALVDDLTKYADGLDTLADRTKAGQGFAEVIQANSPLVRRMNSIATRVTTAVGDLGLVACILPG